MVPSVAWHGTRNGACARSAHCLLASELFADGRSIRAAVAGLVI